MAKKNNDDKYKITERVFTNDKMSIESVLKKYIDNKVDNLIKESYDENEIRAISDKEVA